MIPLAIKYDPMADEAVTKVEERRSGGIARWLRELFRPEPADVRRARIEAEAAAELGLTEHGAGH